MKRTSHILEGVCAAALALSLLLTGCGQAVPQETATEAETEQAETTEATDEATTDEAGPNAREVSYAEMLDEAA